LNYQLLFIFIYLNLRKERNGDTGEKQKPAYSCEILDINNSRGGIISRGLFWDDHFIDIISSGSLTLAV